MFALDKNILSKLDYISSSHKRKVNYDMSSVKTDVAKTASHKHLFLRFTYLVPKKVS